MSEIAECIKELDEATEQAIKFNTTLRNFVLGLKALNNPEVNKLLDKYKVEVKDSE